MRSSLPNSTVGLSIGRVMKEVLSTAQNAESVTLNSHSEESLDIEVTLRILSCEGGRTESGSGTVRFSAAWTLQGLGTNSVTAKRGSFISDALNWNGQDYGQLAERLSQAVAAASRVLAADLPAEAGSATASPSEGRR